MMPTPTPRRSPARTRSMCTAWSPRSAPLQNSWAKADASW